MSPQCLKNQPQGVILETFFPPPVDIFSKKILDMRNLQEQVEKTFCLLKIFWPSTQKICKFSAFSLEFQKFFLITKNFFSHIKSEQFW